MRRTCDPWVAQGPVNSFFLLASASPFSQTTGCPPDASPSYRHMIRLPGQPTFLPSLLLSLLSSFHQQPLRRTKSRASVLVGEWRAQIHRWVTLSRWANIRACRGPGTERWGVLQRGGGSAQSWWEGFTEEVTFPKKRVVPGFKEQMGKNLLGKGQGPT